MKLRQKFAADIFFNFNLVQTAVTVAGALLLLLFMFVAAPGLMSDPLEFARRGLTVALAGGALSLLVNSRHLLALRSFSRFRESGRAVPDRHWPLIEQAAYALPARLFLITLILWPLALVILGWWMHLSGLLAGQEALRIVICGLIYFPIQGLILFYFTRRSLRKLPAQLDEAGRIPAAAKRKVGLRQKLIASFTCLAALPLLAGLLLDGALRERAQVQANLAEACRALARVHALADGSEPSWPAAVEKAVRAGELSFPVAFQVSDRGGKTLAGEFSFAERRAWARERGSGLKPGQCRQLPIPGTRDFLSIRYFENPGVWISAISSPVPETALDFRRYAFTILMVTLVIGLGVLVGYLTADDAGDAVKGLAGYARKAAAGRFEPVTGLLLDDEMEELAQGFNALVDSIHRELIHSSGIIEKLRGVIEGLARQSGSIRELAERQRGVIDEQSPLAMQAAGSAEEVSRAAGEIRDRAHHTQLQMEEVSGQSQTADDLLAEFARLAEELTRAALHTASRMEDLELHLKRMEEAVKVIDDVADRTEMLALNAALEAVGQEEDKARFAVVASEVQRLSERIAEQTKGIKPLFDHIRSVSLDTAEGVQQGRAMAEETPVRLERLKLVLDRIRDRAMTASASMREVAGMTDEQKKALDEMKMVVGEIRTTVEIMDQISSSAESASAELNQLAKGLEEAVKKETPEASPRDL